MAKVLINRELFDALSLWVVQTMVSAEDDIDPLVYSTVLDGLSEKLSAIQAREKYRLELEKKSCNS